MVSPFATRRARAIGTAVIGVAILFVASRLTFTLHAGPTHELPTSEKRPVAHIFEGVSVTQEFPARGERIESVALQLATFARVNEGHVHLEVARRTKRGWETLATDTVIKRVLVDNEYHVFTFEPALEVRSGTQVSLTVTADLSHVDGITWWMSPGWKPPAHRLLVNGVEQDGTAHFDVQYVKLEGRAAKADVRRALWDRLTIFLGPMGQFLLVGGFLLALFGLVHLLLWPFEWNGRGLLHDLRALLGRALPVRRAIGTELLMLFVLAFAVRCVWAFITPPWLGPDELSHFSYAAHIVESGELPSAAPNTSGHPDQPIEALTSCVKTFCNQVSAMALPRVRELNYLPVQEDFSAARGYMATSAAERKSHAGSTATDYPPLYYLFVAAPYRAFIAEPILTRLLSLRVFTALLSALTCVFAYLMAYEARRDRALASVVGLMVALMPMSSFIGACTNNDAAVCAASGAVCWLTVKLARSPVPTLADGAWLGFASGLVFLSKPTGAPIVLLAAAFVLYRAIASKGAPMRERYAGLVAFGAVLFGLGSSWIAARHMMSQGHLGSIGELRVLGVLIEGAPHSFAAYLADLLRTRGAWYMWWLFKSFWALFGWQEIALREKAYVGILVVCSVAGLGFIVGGVRRRLRPIELWLLLTIVGHIAITFVTADYVLSFATTGAPLGLQGRYFLPALAPLMFILARGIQLLAGRRQYVLHLLPPAMFALQVACIVTVVDAYYGIDLG